MEMYCPNCERIMMVGEQHGYCSKCGSKLARIVYKGKDDSEIIASRSSSEYFHTFCGGKVNPISKKIDNKNNLFRNKTVFFCSYCGFRAEEQ